MNDVINLLEFAHQLLLKALCFVLAPRMRAVLLEYGMIEVNLLTELLLDVVGAAQEPESLHLKMTWHLKLVTLLGLQTRHYRAFTHLQHVRLWLEVALVLDDLIQVLNQLFSIAFTCL